MLQHNLTSSSAINVESGISGVQPKVMYRSKYGEFPKLNHLNYSQWHKHMEVVLRAEDAFELTTGNENAPADNQRVHLREYHRRKGKAIALIFGSCTTSAQQYLQGLTDPEEM